MRRPTQPSRIASSHAAGSGASKAASAAARSGQLVDCAAGLALEGWRPIVYSIASFATGRCFEQLRVAVGYHGAPVTVVGAGGGYTYADSGVIHHATEDLAIMRALPNMTVIAPGDPVEAAGATRAVIEWPGPCYLRLGRAGESVVHNSEIEFTIGKSIRVSDGEHLTLISTGGLLQTAVAAAANLLERGIGAVDLSVSPDFVPTSWIFSATRPFEGWAFRSRIRSATFSDPTRMPEQAALIDVAAEQLGSRPEISSPLALTVERFWSII